MLPGDGKTVPSVRKEPVGRQERQGDKSGKERKSSSGRKKSR